MNFAIFGRSLGLLIFEMVHDTKAKLTQHKGNNDVTKNLMVMVKRARLQRELAFAPPQSCQALGSKKLGLPGRLGEAVIPSGR